MIGLRRAAALRAAVPGPLATAGRSHAQLARSLVLWVRRRTDGVPPGAVVIPYGREDRPVAIALLLLSLGELVLVELVVPWPTVRAALLVLGVYGLVLVLAMIADSVVRPHVLTRDSLRLRVGAWADVTLPLSRVTGARVQRGSADEWVSVADGCLVLAAGGSTHAVLTLDGPYDVRVGRRAGPVATMRFSADEPAAAVAAVREAIAARPV